MLFQKLLCCGCSEEVPSSNLQSPIVSKKAHSVTPKHTGAKNINTQPNYQANIKMGEIMKLQKDDKIPYLEVMVEVENEKIQPSFQFIYLHCSDMPLNRLIGERVYGIEKLEWAENIGKSYIRLDFDRNKK
jgi:hypothetical protein